MWSEKKYTVYKRPTSRLRKTWFLRRMRLLSVVHIFMVSVLIYSISFMPGACSIFYECPNRDYPKHENDCVIKKCEQWQCVLCNSWFDVSTIRFAVAHWVQLSIQMHPTLFKKCITVPSPTCKWNKINNCLDGQSMHGLCNFSVCHGIWLYFSVYVNVTSIFSPIFFRDYF